jgi:toxin FitB
MILLDTNVVSELMKAQPDSQVLAWLDAQSAAHIYTSAITLAEIELGIALLPDGKRKDALTAAAETVFTEDFAGSVLPFDQGCAIVYAQLVAVRIRSGRPITTQDAEIAAIALHYNLHLATRNEKDFVGIEGLNLLNPWLID